MTTSKLSRNVWANYVGVFGQIIIAFFLSPFLVHTLGDTRYGIWTIVAALSGYLSLLDFGISPAVTRFVAKYHAKNNDDGIANINGIVSSALMLFVVITAGLVLLSPFISDFIISFLEPDPELRHIIAFLVILVCIDICIFVLTGLLRGVITGFQHFEVSNIAMLSSAIYKALMFYAFLSLDFGLVAMGIISITANFLLAIGYFIYLKKTKAFLRFEAKLANKTHSKEIVKHSKFSFLGMLANQMIYYSDAFVIGYFLSAAHVTYYTIAWSLCEYIKRFALAFSKVFIPAFSHTDSLGERKKLIELYIAGSKYMMIFSNLLCLGGLVFGGAFIGLWMGEKYMEMSTNVLIILLVTLFIQGPQLISYALLQGLSKHKKFAYISMLIAIVNLTLSILLVEKYGILGVAIGSAVPQLMFHGLIVPVLANRALGCSIVKYIKETYAKVLFPSLLLLFMGLIVKEQMFPASFSVLFLQAGLCACIYFISIYLISLNEDEKLVVRSKVKRFTSKV